MLWYIGHHGHPGTFFTWRYTYQCLRFSTHNRSWSRATSWRLVAELTQFVYILFWPRIEQISGPISVKQRLNTWRKLHFMWSWTHEHVEESLYFCCWLEAPCREVIEMVVFWSIWKGTNHRKLQIWLLNQICCQRRSTACNVIPWSPIPSIPGHAQTQY